MGFHEFYQMLDLRNYETRNSHKNAPKLFDKYPKSEEKAHWPSRFHEMVHFQTARKLSPSRLYFHTLTIPHKNCYDESSLIEFCSNCTCRKFRA